MTNDKLCGNCAGDHKFLDCPFIEGRITKIAYKQILKNQEDAKKWRDFRKLYTDADGDWLLDQKNYKEIVERLKKLPFGLILQHIRDSFSEDRELMSVEAQKKTVKCIEDLMELQKILNDE